MKTLLADAHNNLIEIPNNTTIAGSFIRVKNSLPELFMMPKST